MLLPIASVDVIDWDSLNDRDWFLSAYNTGTIVDI